MQKSQKNQATNLAASSYVFELLSGKAPQLRCVVLRSAAVELTAAWYEDSSFGCWGREEKIPGFAMFCLGHFFRALLKYFLGICF